MSIEDSEESKWKVIFDIQRIRNHHEAEYWKTINEYNKQQKIILRHIIIDTIIIFLFWFYILFFCLFD